MSLPVRPEDVAFDPTELQQRCLNNLALAQRVVQAFLADGAAYVREIEGLAGERKWMDVARMAHRLKGASQSVSAIRLARQAAGIEKAAKHDPDTLSDPVAELWGLWEVFQAQAREFCHAPSHSDPAAARD